MIEQLKKKNQEVILLNINKSVFECLKTIIDSNNISCCNNESEIYDLISKIQIDAGDDIEKALLSYKQNV